MPRNFDPDRVLRARPRLLIALGVGIAVAFAAFALPAVRRERELLLMIAWSSACLAWLGSVHLTLRGFDYDCTRQLSEREDDGRAGSRAMLTAGALISLVSVGASIFRAQELAKEKSPMEIVVTVAGVVTVVVTWFLVHVRSAVIRSFEIPRIFRSP